MARRSGQMVPSWIIRPPDTTRAVVWTGSSACSQMADADDAEGETRPTGREPSDECADRDHDEHVRLQQCQRGGITEH